MQERVVELITIVLQELKNNTKIADIDINSLIKKGYSESEISSAFSWLVDRIEFNRESSFGEDNPDSFRVLHEAEQDMFTKEGWGELIQLKSLGIINSEQLEAIIESFMIREIYLADPPFIKKQVWQKIVDGNFEIEYGSRIILKGNETIN
jgi:uncharacterized protein Smg (DUF494 family)